MDPLAGVGAELAQVSCDKQAGSRLPKALGLRRPSMV